MSEDLTRLFEDYDRGRLSRRRLLQTLGLVAVAAPAASLVRPVSLLAQGSCAGTARQGTPLCDTTLGKQPFEPTGWTTVWLDHFSFQVADYQKEAAYYAALMNWKVRSDDGTKAVLDIGDDVGGLVIRGGYQPPAPAAPTPNPNPPANANAGNANAGGNAAGAGRGGGARGGGRGGTPRTVVVENFCWGIEPWNAKKVQAELQKRGLNPVADDDKKNDFESFHVVDPGGFDLQISNGTRKNRRAKPASGKLAAAAPFEATGWKTVWLDHISFHSPDYKASAAFYNALLGWKLGDDEGSQNECQIGDVGNVIIRGTNMAPDAIAARQAAAANGGGTGRGGRGGGAGGADKSSIDHISFGIQPWDADAVKAELDKRGLSNSADTGGKGDIHTASYQSYHTTTPNGFNLQISNGTKASRNTR